MARKRKCRVPEVLRRAFDGCARSIEDTILSLLPNPPPSSPEECRCRGRLCLGCLGHSHLVEQNDPPEYARLLSHTYCFVPQSAPPPPEVFLACGLGQRKIVRNTMELLLDNSKSNTNVLCLGYDKQRRFSSTGEAVCTHAWDLLLERIGDQLMVFLLRFSSIFLPLSNKSYHQVTGPPLSEILQGQRRKRQRVDYEEKPKKSFYTPEVCTLGYNNVIMSENLPSSHSQELYMERLVSPNSHTDNGAIESSGTDGVRKTSICSFQSNSRKRTRLFRWQRGRKHKKLLKPVVPNTSDVSTKECDMMDQNLAGIPEVSVLQDAEAVNNEKSNFVHSEEMYHGNLILSSDENNQHLPTVILDVEPQRESQMGRLDIHSHSEKMTSQCFCCSILRTSQKAAMEDQINRKSIFYKTVSSYSIFPRRHILNRVKPDNSGAAFLMKHIFGFSNEDFHSCIHRSGLGAKNSNCLNHYLLGLLKSLIRNAQHCHYKKLLLRHCPLPTYEQYSKDDKGSTSEVVEERFSLIEREQVRPQFDPIECDARYQQVVSFIWASTRSIVPSDLLGDSCNWRALRSNISKFVGLRRYESFSLSQCTHGLETSRYSFLSKVRLSDCFCCKVANGVGNCKFAKKGIKISNDVKITLQNHIFQNWIYWFFSSIVVPIISSCFYVTERQSKRHHVFYYPKTVWRKIVDNAINCLKEQNYRLLDHASFTYIISKRNFGFSRVRFLPKQKCVRILANTKVPSKIPLHRNNNRKRRFVFLKSINSSLKELHAILRRIKHEHPQALGSSVFGYDDAYRKLYQFLPKVKEGSPMMPKVYIVVGDVSKAFDSINQDKLVEIMKDIIQKDKYYLRSYARVISTTKGIKTFYEQVSSDHSSSSNDIINFEALTRLRPSYSVYIDQGTSKCIKKDVLHLLLTEHLKHNILQIGQNFYLQKVGLSQGSSISCLLCSFYLGHIERSIVLPYLEKAHEQSNANIMNKELVVNRCMLTSDDCRTELRGNASHNIESVKDDVACLGNSAIIDLDEGDVACLDNGRWCQKDHATRGANETRHENLSSPMNLLLRLIDDFLFISTSKQQAISFYIRMTRGFEKYKCFMNNEKFGLNFDAGQNSHLLNLLYTGKDGVQFLPWSGLLLNCYTLEIQADYTRYLDIDISSTITVQANDNVGSLLKVKLCDYMRPKCHPIFYDSNINSPATVRLNAYQAFLLCAIKFHCYVCSISNHTKQNPSYLLEIIEQSFRYMYKLIKKQMHNMEKYINIHPVFRLKKVEMIWLGLFAYIRVLQKRQSRHNELLSLLKYKIGIYGRMDDTSAPLKYAINDSHSSLFWQINF
uniref:Telomerase reverse transcriptase n=5 Tax=Doryanthes excelsa TaxID=49713 RepID=D5MD96_9ASPA|nr:telomerase reverse transcriptase catalytic subunit [Doryanthes excelsa]AAX19887.1 telomerase reverse transcriptase catalytic subunit [Doryanthes excelsa]